MTTLVDFSREVIIVAHREDTTQLRSTLVQEGFAVREVRGPYTQEQLTYSASMRCMLNHANAWRIVADAAAPAIVVEADFVPVQGFGQLLVPVPSTHSDVAFAYLYAVGPQVWDLPEPGIARGHAGGTVALLIAPRVAKLLLQFAGEVLGRNSSGGYLPFDTELGYWLKERGVQSFLPYRHYGEHGGIANPEHARHGLGRPHQADALAAPLAFLPMSASGSVLRFKWRRLRARLWGVARLAFGRTVPWRDWMRTDFRAMCRYAVGRLVTSRPPRCSQ